MSETNKKNNEIEEFDENYLKGFQEGLDLAKELYKEIYKEKLKKVIIFSSSIFIAVATLIISLIVVL